MRAAALACVSALCAVLFLSAAPAAADEPLAIFAVVTKVSKDRRQVSAHVASGTGTVEVALIPADAVLENPIWRKLEVCHSLRAEAWKTAEGYRLVGVRILDAGMLPMPLQGIAGDCLLKKALEFNPQID